MTRQIGMALNISARVFHTIWAKVAERQKNGGDIVIWGTGSVARDFFEVSAHIFIDPPIFVESVPDKATVFDGYTVCSPEYLYELNDPLILIASSYVEEIKAKLFEIFTKKVDVMSVYGLTSSYLCFEPVNSYDDCFVELAYENVNYVVLRESESGGDLDILIEREGLRKLFDLRSFQFCASTNRKKIDIFWDKPIGLPVEHMAFTPYLSDKLLSNKIFFENKYILNAKYESLSGLYHIFYFKSHFADDDGSFHKCEKYSNKIKRYLALLDADYSQLNTKNIYQALNENDFSAPIDFARYIAEKLIRHKASYGHLWPFIKPCLDERQVFTLVVRERVTTEIADWSEKILEAASGASLYFLCSVDLEANEREIIQRQFRGGNWFDNSATRMGGRPCKLLFFGDSRVTANDFETNNRYLLPCVNTRWASLKRAIRDEFYPDGSVNPIHGTDDHFDSMLYLRLIYGEEIETIF